MSPQQQQQQQHRHQHQHQHQHHHRTTTTTTTTTTMTTTSMPTTTTTTTTKTTTRTPTKAAAAAAATATTTTTPGLEVEALGSRHRVYGLGLRRPATLRRGLGFQLFLLRAVSNLRQTTLANLINTTPNPRWTFSPVYAWLAKGWPH